MFQLAPDDRAEGDYIARYAVDHLGLSLAELRESREAKYWDSTNKAAEAVRDLSVFELVTNFVRLRRIEGR